MLTKEETKKVTLPTPIYDLYTMNMKSQYTSLSGFSPLKDLKDFIEVLIQKDLEHTVDLKTLVLGMENGVQSPESGYFDFLTALEMMEKGHKVNVVDSNGSVYYGVPLHYSCGIICFGVNNSKQVQPFEKKHSKKWFIVE